MKIKKATYKNSRNEKKIILVKDLQINQRNKINKPINILKHIFM